MIIVSTFSVLYVAIAVTVTLQLRELFVFEGRIMCKPAVKLVRVSS